MERTEGFRPARQGPLPPPLTEAELADTQSEGAINRRNGRIAAYLFIAGGIAGAPAIALHDPALSPAVFLLPVLAFVSGAVCLLIPWQRLSPRWLHAVAVIGSLEVLATTMLVSPVFSWYFALVAVYGAYVFSTRIEVAAQGGFAGALMFASAWSLEGSDGIGRMLIAVPAVITTTVLVWALREQLERRQAGYRLLSRRDPLTGVGNYRELHDALADQVARHGAAQRRFALILVDLDRFKRINDLHGHLEGDRVLRETAAMLADTVRGGELVARHGGDEFSVVAPETSEGEAGELALRLEQAISRLTVADRALRASTGCAVYPDDGGDSDELMAAADRSLRREKRARRELTTSHA